MPTTTIENILTTTKTTPTTIASNTKITAASTISTTEVQPKINAARTTSRRTGYKSTTEAIPITEETINKEAIAPIEIKMLTTASVYTTEKSSSIYAGSTSVSNIIVQNTTRQNNEIITLKPILVRDTTTVSFINQIFDKDAVIADATHTVSLKDIVNTETTAFVKPDTYAKVPMTDVVLLKNNSIQDNIIPATILSINNGTQSTIETTTKTAESISDKESSVETTTATAEMINRSHLTLDFNISKVETTVKFTTTEATKPSMISELPIIQTTQKKESTIRVETTSKVPTTTVKFKPKEIWIKPAQKSDSIELKSKNNHDLQRNKPTNKESAILTTPKTIIVSIIPTSVSYTQFKKIALTTSAYIPTKISNALKNTNKTEQTSTKPTPTSLKINSTTEISTRSSLITSGTSSTKFISLSPIMENTTATISTSSIIPESIETNSMTTNAVTSNNFTVSTNTITKLLTTTPTMKTVESTKANKPIKNYHWIKAKESFKTNKTLPPKLEVPMNRTAIAKIATSINKTLTNPKIATEAPADEETFHILTEPEHITAVMGDKENDRTSMDLKSVISIAGGVMMAVITAAVIIVMIERCKRPRYEDVRKINDIRMQVMIDDNDVPPPYVRSIFHTPLPGNTVV